MLDRALVREVRVLDLPRPVERLDDRREPLRSAQGQQDRPGRSPRGWRPRLGAPAVNPEPALVARRGERGDEHELAEHLGEMGPDAAITFRSS